jgi:hypothetical protein
VGDNLEKLVKGGLSEKEKKHCRTKSTAQKRAIENTTGYPWSEATLY